MLWRRHQPPFPTGETRVKRSKVPRSNGDHSAWVQMPTAKGQGVLRVGKVLDDVQQYDDIEHAQLRKNSLRGNSFDHGKTAASAKRDGCIRDFNTGHIVKATGFFQKESIGASDFQKPPTIMKTTDELNRACKFPTQHRFATAIVGVTVSMPPREIIFGVIGVDVKTAAFGTTNATFTALQNVTGVF
jgi:hypothetical protein